MTFRRTLLAAAIAGLFVAPVFAQTSQQDQIRETQRDFDQQQRIEQGLQNGSLTTQEAGKLEREETRVENMQSRAAASGSVSPREQARINAAQNKVSRDIAAQKHDAQVGNPNSVSSKRMQADVQRNLNQQERINQGVKSGALTTRETGRMERQQARTNRMEANAAANGRVGAAEQARIQKSENRHNRHIRRQKHDAQTR